MPNWCANSLSISGCKSMVSAFVNKASNGKVSLSFANLFPCPQSLIDAPAGSDEIYYDIVHGDLSKLAGYAWIPDEIKTDRDALMSFLTNRSGIAIEKGREIADLIKNNLETYGFSNWYKWCCANWGVKWDIEGSGGLDNEDHASYTFDSAWGPPREAFIEISKNFPGLTFDLEYFEPGMCFCGRDVITNGTIVDTLYDEFGSKEDIEEIIEADCYNFVQAELENHLAFLAEMELDLMKDCR